MSPTTKGWIVAFAGLGINMAAGLLYSWSMFASSLGTASAANSFRPWSALQANWPFAVGVAWFAVTVHFAGRMHAIMGSRWVASLGGVFMGMGLLIAALTPIPMGSSNGFPVIMVVGYGLVASTGMGLSFAATLPAAHEWFAPAKRVLVSGLVLGGLGLSTLLGAPLSAQLLSSRGVNGALLLLGLAFPIVIVGLAQLLGSPPNGYVPPGSYAHPARPVAVITRADSSWKTLLRNRGSFSIWLTCALSALGGLMVASVLARLGAPSPQSTPLTTSAYAAVAVYGVGVAVGWPAAVMLSGRIGRHMSVVLALLVQTAATIALGFVHPGWVQTLAAFFVGTGLGAVFCLLPSATPGFPAAATGKQHDGLVLSAWGLGGALGSLLAAIVFDSSVASSGSAGSYLFALVAAALGLLVAVLVSALTGRPVRALRAMTAAGAKTNDTTVRSTVGRR